METRWKHRARVLVRRLRSDPRGKEALQWLVEVCHGEPMLLVGWVHVGRDADLRTRRTQSRMREKNVLMISTYRLQDTEDIRIV